MKIPYLKASSRVLLILKRNKNAIFPLFQYKFSIYRAFFRRHSRTHSRNYHIILSKFYDAKSKRFIQFENEIMKMLLTRTIGDSGLKFFFFFLIYFKKQKERERLFKLHSIHNRRCHSALNYNTDHHPYSRICAMR